MYQQRSTNENHVQLLLGLGVLFMFIGYVLALPWAVHQVLLFFWTGLAVTVYACFRIVKARGILSFLSAETRATLLNKSIIDLSQDFVEWLYAPTGILEILSLFLVQMDQAQIAGTIRRMPREKQIVVRTPGIVNLLSPSSRALFFPEEQGHILVYQGERLVSDNAPRLESSGIATTTAATITTRTPIAPTAVEMANDVLDSQDQNWEDQCKQDIPIDRFRKFEHDVMSHVEDVLSSKQEDGISLLFSRTQNFFQQSIKSAFVTQRRRLIHSLPFFGSLGQSYGNRWVGIVFAVSVVATFTAQLYVSSRTRRWAKTWANFGADSALFLATAATVAASVLAATRKPNSAPSRPYLRFVAGLAIWACWVYRFRRAIFQEPHFKELVQKLANKMLQ